MGWVRLCDVYVQAYIAVNGWDGPVERRYS